MGLDISFNNTVVSVHLTHNLTTMAKHISCNNGLTLYDVLWRGNDHNILISDDIEEHLLTALKYMTVNKDNLVQFNPSNGWGLLTTYIMLLKSYPHILLLLICI